jgi:hypothetical protein
VRGLFGNIKFKILRGEKISTNDEKRYICVLGYPSFPG